MELNWRFKDILKDSVYYLGIPKFLLWLLHCLGNPLLLIFVYHRVNDPLNNHGYIGVPIDIFEQQMRFIKNNFKVVSMIEGLRALSDDNSEGIYAAVNFDDGYMDNYLCAYPILKKYEIPATVFLTTDFMGKCHIFWWDKVFQVLSFTKLENINISIDSKSFNLKLGGIAQRERVSDYINRVLANKEESVIQDFIEELERQCPDIKEITPYRMLGWEEIREMHTRGISFGSHTKTHRNLCLLKDHEAEEELRGSKREIEERLGICVTEFSYPFGIADERGKGLVVGAGYKCAKSNLKGLNFKYADRYELACIDTGGVSNIRQFALRTARALFITKVKS